MITERELNTISLSPINKDFYQIWTELMDTATKISERWDPTSTNETDPGIVLLKVLTAIGDKLNYNIDKNILEAFMPTAAQEESMRKLCEMMGYNMKYYQSATTNITLAYTGDISTTEEKLPEAGLSIPIFTVISNKDKDVNYITTESALLTNDCTKITIPVMEGQLVRCENDSNNVISLDYLDDENRYYLPEVQIAENGIFIYNINDSIRSTRWKKVDNLNTQATKQLVYKFGFDSTEARPYIQFPEDIGNIIEDGLEIFYLRTSGNTGNVSANILSEFEFPTTEDWENYTNTEKFVVTNPSAAVNGQNVETITQAYTNFKKTIGTFDTLVTCRDYMNKIYSLMSDNNKPFVSNIIAADIRDDINRAQTICSFNSYGIYYKELPIVEKVTKEITGTTAEGTPATISVTETVPQIDNFNIILYPFKIYNNINNKADFKNSFTYTDENKNIIEASLEDTKTLSHSIKYPKDTDVVCIKNYLKLNARITTTVKVNQTEGKIIKQNINTALYKAFNLRQLDFGEEIPFESILQCIEQADARIKNVALEEPSLLTKFVLANGKEYSIADTIKLDNETTAFPGKEIYTKLALRNILAGRVELFKYDTTFIHTPDEIKDDNYESFYPIEKEKPITRITTECLISTEKEDSANPITTLSANEVIKFRAPNFKTAITYPAYVNYYLYLSDATLDTDNIKEVPATFQTLKEFLSTDLAINPPEEPFSSDSFATWYTWLKSLTGNDGNKFSGFYKRLSQDLSKNTGYLIDKDYYKYGLISQWYAASGDPLEFYFVPKTYKHSVDWTATQQQEVVEDNGILVTTDGLGKNAVVVSIPQNMEYQLKSGDYLLINYTEANTTTSDAVNTTSTIKNIIYTNGTIIKPNFALKDSLLQHNTEGKGWSKTSGFSFNNADGIPEISGMYSLSSNEQIEIREQSRVFLDEPITKIYWIFNNDTNSLKAPVNIGKDNIWKYTLQDGEYLFYTNANEIDMAYYGAGTELVMHGDISFISSSDNAVSLEKILSEGITAIPWKTENFSRTNTATDRYIELREFQYITLTEGDILQDINFSTASLNPVTSISNVWQTCTEDSTGKIATYYVNGIFSSLPRISVTGANWEVRSLLELSVGPDKKQELNERDKVTLWTGEEPNFTELKTLSGTEIDGIKSTLAFKTNKSIKSATEQIDTRTVIYYPDTGEQEYISDLALNVFKYIPFGIKYRELPKNEESTPEITLDKISGEVYKTDIISLNTFDSLWTKISAQDLKITPLGENRYLKTVDFNLNIPENKIALIMFYYDYEDSFEYDDVFKHACLTYDNDSKDELVIFNNNVSTDSADSLYDYVGQWSWWSDRKTFGTNTKKLAYDANSILKIGSQDSPAFCLKKGLNVIVALKSGTLHLLPDLEYKSTITFSGIDLIDLDLDTEGSKLYNIGLNLQLLGFTKNSYTEETKEEWSNTSLVLLKLLKERDPNFEFYYNCPMDKGTVIDLNESLLGTSDEETLSSPRTWYDYNNLNNKFVISEIDSDYLDTGIQIAKSSQL